MSAPGCWAGRRPGHPKPRGRPAAGAASSHGLGVPATYALGRALDRLPGRLVVYAVEAADVRPGLA